MIERERECLLYFLLTGQKVNVSCLICHQMVQVRKRKRIYRLFFDNLLTQYLRKEEVEEEREFNIVIPAPLRGTDITSICLKKENDMIALTGTEHNAHDDGFMAISMGC